MSNDGNKIQNTQNAQISQNLQKWLINTQGKQFSDLYSTNSKQQSISKLKQLASFGLTHLNEHHNIKTNQLKNNLRQLDVNLQKNMKKESAHDLSQSAHKERENLKDKNIKAKFTYRKLEYNNNHSIQDLKKSLRDYQEQEQKLTSKQAFHAQQSKKQINETNKFNQKTKYRQDFLIQQALKTPVELGTLKIPNKIMNAEKLSAFRQYKNYSSFKQNPFQKKMQLLQQQQNQKILYQNIEFLKNLKKTQNQHHLFSKSILKNDGIDKIHKIPKNIINSENLTSSIKQESLILPSISKSKQKMIIMKPRPYSIYNPTIKQQLFKLNFY